MSAALIPYMASRGSYPLSQDTLYGPTMALFPYNGTITFRWGEVQGNTSIPAYFAITANGRWGGQQASHVPVVFVTTTLPAATVTYADEVAMQADVNQQPYEVNESFNTTNAAIAGIGAERWICHGRSVNKTWVPIRTKVAVSTATIAGFSCDVYTCDVDVADIPKIGDMPMNADEVFDLCWAVNGRHASDGFDAVFKLTPVGFQLQDRIVERIELNARVAGQRAIKQDEMLTRSQLEAGKGVNLVYRDATGSAAEYSQEASKGYNIIVEAVPSPNPIIATQWQAPPAYADENWLPWSWSEVIAPPNYAFQGRFMKWQVGPYGVSYKGQPTTTFGVATPILSHNPTFAQQYGFSDWWGDKTVIWPTTGQPTTGDARSIEILTTGLYRIHSLIDGYFWVQDAAESIVFNAHLMLRLYWKGEAAPGYSHILDRWQYDSSWPNDLLLPEGVQPGTLQLYEDKKPWIISGDQTMWLQAGTRLWSGFTGFSRQPSAFALAVVPTYHYFEIEYLGQATPSVMQYPLRLPTNQILARA